jgi:hypothetical protein
MHLDRATLEALPAASALARARIPFAALAATAPVHTAVSVLAVFLQLGHASRAKVVTVAPATLQNRVDIGELFQPLGPRFALIFNAGFVKPRERPTSALSASDGNAIASNHAAQKPLRQHGERFPVSGSNAHSGYKRESHCFS